MLSSAIKKRTLWKLDNRIEQWKLGQGKGAHSDDHQNEYRQA